MNPITRGGAVTEPVYAYDLSNMSNAFSGVTKDELSNVGITELYCVLPEIPKDVSAVYKENTVPWYSDSKLTQQIGTMTGKTMGTNHAILLSPELGLGDETYISLKVGLKGTLVE